MSGTETSYVIVNTDNFGGDYPDEKFVASDGGGDPALTLEPGEAVIYLSKELAQKEADRLNSRLDEYAPRYYKLERIGYKLQPGFEP